MTMLLAELLNVRALDLFRRYRERSYCSGVLRKKSLNLFYNKCKRSYIHLSITVGVTRKWAATLRLAEAAELQERKDLRRLWQTELATKK